MVEEEEEGRVAVMKKVSMQLKLRSNSINWLNSGRELLLSELLSMSKKATSLFFDTFSLWRPVIRPIVGGRHWIWLSDKLRLMHLVSCPISKGRCLMVLDWRWSSTRGRLKRLSGTCEMLLKARLRIVRNGSDPSDWGISESELLWAYIINKKWWGILGER